MPNYLEMSKAELAEVAKQLRDEYNEFKARGLKLDMSRGKPGADQLDYSMPLLKEVSEESGAICADGTDSRNYGMPIGIPECRELFAQILGVESKNVIVCGSSSLNIMFDFVSQCMTHGAGDEPWLKQGKIKFLTPVPGYDRHFAICEYFGIEMVNVPMLSDGPDMDVIEELIKDSSVKGMFCVPKYSNPEGKTFSEAVVERIAKLKPAAKDFRIIWDNAYCVHTLSDEGDVLPEIFSACKKYGSEDMIIEVASSSKISFPGAGISAIVASDKNFEMIRKRMAVQTICNDKINQLRHVRFFRDIDGINAHMSVLGGILRPKFEVVLEALDSKLADTGVASWNRPKGGYFISLDVLDGCAKRTVELCKEAGVVLTPAGATFPYGKDENDRNIRIAPTYPPVEELKTAVELLCVCVRLAAAEKILEK